MKHDNENKKIILKIERLIEKGPYPNEQFQAFFEILESLDLEKRMDTVLEGLNRLSGTYDGKVSSGIPMHFAAFENFASETEDPISNKIRDCLTEQSALNRSEIEERWQSAYADRLSFYGARFIVEQFSADEGKELGTLGKLFHGAVTYCSMPDASTARTEHFAEIDAERDRAYESEDLEANGAMS